MVRGGGSRNVFDFRVGHLTSTHLSQDHISYELSRHNRGLLDLDCDLGWMKQCVVDQAVVDGAFYAGAVLI
jgi:hypothetical protein